MIIMLYKQGAKEAFRIESNPCDVRIDKKTNCATVFGADGKETTYKVIEKGTPKWSDDSKPEEYIFLKMVVE